MRLAWRYVVLAAFLFWVGGFTFYTSVVVPIGTRVLGSGTSQGFITREVTVGINRAAAVSLALLLVDLFVTPGTPRTRLALWLVMAVCQTALFWLHPILDSYLVVEMERVRERAEFYQRHRVYLWLHTVQWAAALAYLGLLMAAWGRGPVSDAGQPSTD